MTVHRILPSFEAPSGLVSAGLDGLRPRRLTIDGIAKTIDGRTGVAGAGAKLQRVAPLPAGAGPMAQVTVHDPVEADSGLIGVFCIFAKSLEIG